MVAVKEEVSIVEKMEDPRLDLVQRIYASSNFRGSTRLRAFLSYVVNCAIQNVPEAVTEQQIGVHVFGRRVGYNTNDDNIVRSQARLLRLKLAAYFAEEGEREVLIVFIPKGQYLPSFRPASARKIPQETRVPTSHSLDLSTSFGGECETVGMDEAQRVRFLEHQNWRLKKLVVDLSLDREALRAVVQNNGWSLRY